MLGIYDAMQFIKAPVSTTGVGQVAGSAAILLAAGAPGRRIVLPHARVVLQQPSQDGTRGDLPDLLVAAKEIARLRAELNEILAFHSGRTPDQVQAETDRDLVLGATQAVDYGVADAVVESRKTPGAAWKAAV